MRRCRTYAVTIREREFYFLSTISVRYYLQSYLQRTDDKDKNKEEKGADATSQKIGFEGSPPAFCGESRKPVYPTAIKRQRTAAEEIGEEKRGEKRKCYEQWHKWSQPATSTKVILLATLTVR